MERPTVHPSGRLMNYSVTDNSPKLAAYYGTGERVEIEWFDGYEDYSGYGARTEGRKARGYIRKSTGWCPAWLLIFSRRSIGGGTIAEKDIKSIRGLGVYR